MYLGIDIGSMSCKAIVLSNENKTLFSKYMLHRGDPLSAVKNILDEAQKVGLSSFLAICTTGSGRKLIGKAIGAHLIKNEITCLWKAASVLYPEVRTIIEIGGQDSKLITVKDGEISRFKLNSVCAAGTGSFIEQQAARLGITVEELARRASHSNGKAKFTGRCTVFVETEMINLQQRGASLEDIASGLMDAICENYLKDLSPGMELHPPVMFCGGVSMIEPIKKSFEKQLKSEIFVPEVNCTTAAYGAALLAMSKALKEGLTELKEINIVNVDLAFQPNCQANCSQCGACHKNL